MSSKRRKLITAVGATALAVAIALTGTFAWQSISQQAKNEAMASVNPGGRLHDDFDGRNKDVYVENFTDPGDGAPIFARVRLDEYMEIGAGAGLKTNDDGFAEKKAQSLEVGAKIDDVTTWKTHVPNNPDNKFDDYWNWTTGGSTTFMPTFNKNKDSLAADINGTYEGTTPSDDTHYDDYKAWQLGEQKTADAIYDADTNDTDEGEGALEGTSIEKKNETHTAKATGTATVKTMEEWLALPGEQQVGAYWVWDKDGWAYWAQAIQPGEATGLLLDGIELKSTLSDSWYYGINVVGQFVTADDLGQKDNTGFYDTQAGKAPTENAEKLLSKIGVQVSGKVDKVELTAASNATSVVKGNTLQFNAKVKLGSEDAEDQTVAWAVEGKTSDSTSINGSGLLTVGADESAQTLTVTATHTDHIVGAIHSKATVNVRSTWAAPIDSITPGSDTTVTIQNIEFYVLAKEGNKAMLLTKDAHGTHAFDTDSPMWEGSDLQTYLNGPWLNGYATLKAAAVETTFYTRSTFDGQGFTKSTDKVFLLSEADVFGTQNNQPAQAQDYTYNGAKLPAPGGSWGVSWLVPGDPSAWYWLRSPYVNASFVAGVDSKGDLYSNFGYNHQHASVRPALWVDLSK